MTERLVDSHCHLGDSAFAEDRLEVIRRAEEAGVHWLLNICTDEETLQTGLGLSAKYPWIGLCAATTPHDVKEVDPFFDRVVAEATAGHLTAVGESGLDYYYERAPRALQRFWLERYLEIAHKFDLPLVIHCRDAYPDLFAMLDSCPPIRGVLHCFTGSLEEARGVIERGLYLSMSGIVTFKRSESLREVLSYVPLDRLLVETDAPYLAPQTRRGKRNEPAYLKETVEVVAAHLGRPSWVVAETTALNAAKLFGLPLVGER